MANTVIITRTKFTALSATRTSENSTTYGYRMSDDYATEFADTLFITDMHTHRLDFLKSLLNDELPATEGIGEMLTHIADNKKGIVIDDKFFDWIQIKELFEGTHYEAILRLKEVDKQSV